MQRRERRRFAREVGLRKTEAEMGLRRTEAETESLLGNRLSGTLRIISKKGAPTI